MRLLVDELLSKLKSSKVDRKLRAKFENPIDSHSLALVSGSGLGFNTNPSTRQFYLPYLVLMLDEEFKVLSEDDLALLSTRFGQMYENRKETRKNSSMYYRRCDKMRHFIVECLEAIELKNEYKQRPKNDYKHENKDERRTKKIDGYTSRRCLQRWLPVRENQL
jgi:hypothetical protein